MNEQNYLMVGVAVVAAVALIIWLVRRNFIDKKDFEQELIDSEIKPEDDKDSDQIKL